MHHAERQRGVGCGGQLHMPVSMGGGRCAYRVNHHHLCAALARSRDRAAPQMHIGGDGIGAPDHNQAAVFQIFRQQRRPRADGGCHRVIGDIAADLAIDFGGTEPREKLIACVALQEPDSAGEIARHGGQWPVFGNTFLQARDNRRECFVPTNTRKRAAALGAAAFERMENTVRAVDPRRITFEFGAQGTARVGMIGGAFDLHRASAVVDRHLPGAGIRTVVGAGTVNLFHERRSGWD